MTKYFSENYNDYGWSVYYFSINNFTIINYCLMFAFIDKEKLGQSVNTFVLVDAIFTAVLWLAIVLNYKGVLEHTYGFYISILGMIITTILIVIIGVRYGYFKD